MSFQADPTPDPFAHLRRHLADVPEAPFHGAWATVDVQPDLFARQRYTVGVVVCAQDGELQFQLLKNVSRFECIYDKKESATLLALLESAASSLRQAQRNQLDVGAIRFETDMLMLGELWPTSGASIGAVVSRLYLEVVPLEPKDLASRQDFPTMDNETVRELVNRELKRIAGTAFEHIVTEEARHRIEDSRTGTLHWLDFNLHPLGKVGSVVSAVYKSPTRVSLSVLGGAGDVSTFARLHKLDDRALFVMTPSTDSMSARHQERLANVLGGELWKIQTQGFRVEAHDAAEPIAQRIFEWAGVPAL